MLLGTSIAVRNVAYIAAHPLMFFLEIAAVGLVAAAPIILVGYTRGIDHRTIWVLYSLFVVKLCVFHVLFELSGVYDMLFNV